MISRVIKYAGTAAAIWLLLSAPLFGETFLVVVEEFRGGEALEPPLASQEGLMSAMFDLGHITFETGMYRPEMSWNGLQFSEPMRLAREGSARYLAVVRVFAEIYPLVERSEDPGGNAPTGEGLEIESQAEYLLFDAESSRLLGRGEVTASSVGEQRILSYEELLFQTGETVARELSELCRESGFR
jgi:hypothetical protein